MLSAALSLLLMSVPTSGSLHVRVSGALGTMGELTWQMPSAQLIGALHLGEQTRFDLRLGYASLDNHTYLSDGRIVRGGLGVSLEVVSNFSVGIVFGLDHLLFHADPDVLALEPDVDLLEVRGGFLPTLGTELSYRLYDRFRMGLFGKLGLVDIVRFDSDSGVRLVLVGLYLEVRAL